eukprot:GEMP01012888.1.p1 GENE.GEMP01012888.1~~GEMP01012888.1.p1  ORF type:complete len:512 (+),score=129.86 GEMP01012888.1:3-1538(+)
MGGGRNGVSILVTELETHNANVRDALTHVHESIIFTLVPHLVELSSRTSEVDNALQLPHYAHDLLLNFGLEVRQVHRHAHVLLKAPCEYTVRVAEQIRETVDACMGPVGRGLAAAARYHKEAKRGAKTFRLTKIHFCACIEKLTWLVDGGGLDYVQATVDKFVHVAKGETKELERQEKIASKPKHALSTYSLGSDNKQYQCAKRTSSVPRVTITASIDAEKLVVDCLELIKNYDAQIATALSTITTNAAQIERRMDRLDSALNSMTATFRDLTTPLQTADTWFDSHIKRLFKLDGSIHFYISSIDAQLPAIDRLLNSTNIRQLVMHRWVPHVGPLVENINAFVTDCLLHAFEEGILDTITALSAQLDALGKLIFALKRNCERFHQALVNAQWKLDGCTAAVSSFCTNLFHGMKEVHDVVATRRSPCPESRSACPESLLGGFDTETNTSEGNAPCGGDGREEEEHATSQSNDGSGRFSYVGSVEAFSSAVIDKFYGKRRFACLRDALIGAAA